MKMYLSIKDPVARHFVVLSSIIKCSLYHYNTSAHTIYLAIAFQDFKRAAYISSKHRAGRYVLTPATANAESARNSL
jgi:hypothetical protein